MFFIKTKEDIREELHNRHKIEVLEEKIQELTASKTEADKLKTVILEKESIISQLKADIVNAQKEVEFAKKDIAIAQQVAKSEYAENVMAIVDERVAELKKMYEDYTKQFVEVVKASQHPLPVLLTEKTITNVTK